MTTTADPPGPPPAAGLVTVPSSHPVATTLDRLQALLERKGTRVFARIDHGAGAAEVGLPLRPTQVLLFGNPQAGTPLMQAGQTIGIDLPLKALAWEDEAGRTWLTYNLPQYLADRHAVRGRDAVVAAMTALLRDLIAAATST